MPIDARIPLMAEGVNVGQLDEQIRQRKLSDLQFQQAQEDRQRQTATRGSLADLIKTRGPNGQLDTSGQAFQSYTDNDPQGALGMLKTMDADKRQHLEAGLKDLSGAVQWADTPEKWAVVQRHVAQFDPQAAATPFERREEVLVSLNQMGEHLKANKHEFHSVTEGGSAYDFNPATGASSMVIAPNPGGQQPGAPVQGGAVSGSPLVRPQQAPTPRPAGMTDAQLFEQAHEAVRHGANVDDVFRRLQSWGVNP